jgi:flagellar motility protein MotE (MotC chaperone)
MRRFSIFLAMLIAAGGAGAQMYKWVDKDGKVRYSDTPPPAGVKTSTVKAPPAAPAAAAAPAAKDGKDAKDAKGAKKGPLTPAEQEQEYRKRRAEADKAAEKAAADQKELATKKADCERAREYLRTLESGQRVTRTNAQGERVFLDESQVAAEAASARQAAQTACK